MIFFFFFFFYIYIYKLLLSKKGNVRNFYLFQKLKKEINGKNFLVALENFFNRRKISLKGK